MTENSQIEVKSDLENVEILLSTFKNILRKVYNIIERSIIHGFFYLSKWKNYVKISNLSNRQKRCEKLVKSHHKALGLLENYVKSTLPLHHWGYRDPLHPTPSLITVDKEITGAANVGVKTGKMVRVKPGPRLPHKWHKLGQASSGLNKGSNFTERM